MSPRYCSVVDCKNSTKNSTCKFYTFPTASHKLQQRDKWIAAVKRKNDDGTAWVPKRCDYICSNHFIGNKKGEEENSPSYVPTIFPSVYGKRSVNEITAANRHARFMKRRIDSMKSTVASRRQNVLEQSFKLNERTPGALEDVKIEYNITTTNDQWCQVTSFNNELFDRTFICNRIGFDGKSVWDVEIQTNINEHPRAVITPNRKKNKDKQCGREANNYVNVSAGPNLENENLNTSEFSGFSGYLSIKKEEQLLDFEEVTF
ncbi:hypothetical protein JTB14_005671 [Gonioctena quinquepunctata]|nr:hypothetical protein JTB14_005671 [Gonioctena quinquepunctata]